MKWGKDGKYDNIKDWFASEEGQASVKEFVAEMNLKEERKNKHILWIKKFYSNQAEFDSLMDRIIERHDDRWDNVCLKQGYMTYPWEVLYTIFNIAENEGTELSEPLDSFTANFPSSIFEYMGWQFAITQGQGAVMSIYKNKTFIISI